MLIFICPFAKGSDNVTNKLQMGYTHFDDFRNALSTPAPSITLQNNGANYIIAGHEPFSINNTLDQKVYQITNNLNVVEGNHTFTVGFSFEKFTFDNSFNLGVYGAQGVFFPTGDIQAFRDAQGDPAAEAALVAIYQGMFNTAISNNASLSAAGEGNAGGFALAETNVGQLAFYVQDEWNVTDNFKLTYGVRFDRPLYFDSAENAQDVIDVAPAVVPGIEYFNPNTGENVLIDNTTLPTNDWLFSPRVGFNWDAKGDSSLQVRGGSGLFTGRFPFVWLGNQIGNPNVFFLQAVDPEYEFPQVWRTNIGTDYRFKNGLILSGDIAFTKDINGAHVQNWGLRNPSGILQGVDNRPIYTADDIINNAYVFTNTDEGRIWNFTLKAQKTFKGGYYTSLAYNYLDSRDVNSIEAEITSDAFNGNAISGNANDEVLSHSRYGDKHRFVGVASIKWTYGKEKFATTISTFFEYAQGGRFNYTYGGDLNGDGSNFNDLLYIPTANEIGQMQFSGTPAEQLEQASALEAYIQQDDYLSENRGRYAERYGALAPWRGRWDIKFLQDFNFKIGGKTHTLQLSADILNVGNLLNSDWGVIEQPNNIQPIGVTFPNASTDPTVFMPDRTQSPIYTFDPSLAETFGDDTSLESRWQAQFGIRYIF